MANYSKFILWKGQTIWKKSILIYKDSEALPFVASNVPLILLLLLINIIFGYRNVEKKKIDKWAGNRLEVYNMNRVFEMYEV